MIRALPSGNPWSSPFNKRNQGFKIGRIRLNQELKEIEQREQELIEEYLRTEKRIEALPKEIKRQEKRRHERFRLQVLAESSADGIKCPRDKWDPVKRKRFQEVERSNCRERRAARNQFFLLFVLLAAILLLLYRSLP